jgi:hypothetical protein
MGIIFDQRVGVERKTFATQISEIDKNLIEQISQNFTGKEPLEFYEGLLAGYACCYSIMGSTSKENSENIIGGIIAYISEILEERA